MIEVPVSIGELLDKLSILEIKSRRITDSSKLANITKEMQMLTSLVRKNEFLGSDVTRDLYAELTNVNETLWDLEDSIRDKERNKCFDEEFVEISRSIYRQNDLRCDLKTKLNSKLGSKIFEEKGYARYE